MVQENYKAAVHHNMNPPGFQVLEEEVQEEVLQATHDLNP
jgi:hypothetical protein